MAKMTSDELVAKLNEAGIDAYKDRSGYPTSQAQRNLEGKSHYVDESNLKFHKANIISCTVLDDGLLLGIVESVAANASGDTRVFRPVFFDLFGTVIHRPDLEDAFKTSKQAQSAFWKKADEIDAIDTTLKGIQTRQAALQGEITKLKRLSAELDKEEE